MALSLIAPEELRMGRKYFLWMFYSVLGIIIAMLLPFDNLASILCSIVVIFTFVKLQISRRVIFNLSSIGLYFGYQIGMFDIIAGLTLLLGFPIGSLFCTRFENDDEIDMKVLVLSKKITMEFWLFLIPVCVLFFFI